MDEPIDLGVWERAGRRRRGPAPEYSLERIAIAAIALADAGGLAAVTMRAVAAGLGTGPASLYRYVDTREELVELMTDQVNGEFDYGGLPGGDWLADLLSLARQSRDIYLRHPWLLEAVGPLRQAGPNAADYLEHALAALKGLEVDSRTKLEAIGLVNALVFMLARSEAASSGASETRRTGAYLVRVAAEGRHPHLADALGDQSGDEEGTPPEVLFDRVVERMLTGLLAPRL